MRTFVGVGALSSGPEIIDIALVVAGPDGPTFSELIRPADQNFLARLLSVIDPSEFRPGDPDALAMLVAGHGKPPSVVTNELFGWWAANIGLDGYAGSRRPVLVAHDAHVVRATLKQHFPLIEELFSDQIDVTTLRAVTDWADADIWETAAWPRAIDAATSAVETFERVRASLSAETAGDPNG